MPARRHPTRARRARGSTTSLATLLIRQVPPPAPPTHSSHAHHWMHDTAAGKAGYWVWNRHWGCRCWRPCRRRSHLRKFLCCGNLLLHPRLSSVLLHASVKPYSVNLNKPKARAAVLLWFRSSRALCGAACGTSQQRG